MSSGEIASSFDDVRVSAGVAAASELLPEIVSVLVEEGLTLATAESLTGGALAARIVDVPGVSAVLRGGVVSYSSEVKCRLLDVPWDLLQAHGAVDREVAIEMARGACRVLESKIALATTGVAGPGPNEGKPAGTVWVAIAGVLGERAVLLHATGDRREIRQAAVEGALALLAEVLELGGAAEQE